MINKIKAELLFSKGQNQAKQGFLEESIKSFDKAISLNPHYSGIYLHKALSLSKRKEYKAAQNSFATAIEMQPMNPAYHLFLGIFQYDLRNYDEAYVAFENSLKLCPDNYMALCYKNLILLIQGKELDAATGILKKYLEYTNYDFKSKLLEYCETICFKNSKSARSFDVIHKLNSEASQKPLSNISDFFSLALTSFYYTLPFFSSLGERSAFKHYKKATRAQLSGQFDEAIKDYWKVLEFDAKFGGTVDNLIGLYGQSKDYHSFLKFIKELPIYSDIESIISIGKNDETIREDIAHSMMQYSSLIFMLAYIYYQIDNYDNAIDIFQLLSKYNQASPLVSYYLGLICISRNDPDEARRLFQLALEGLDQKVLIFRLEEMLNLLSENIDSKHA